MKKVKIFTKGQALLVLMVIALGAAVWLNMKFTSKEKYLGEASYVSQTSSAKTVQTSAKAQQNSKASSESTSDYFTAARKNRETALKNAQKQIDEMLDNDKLTEADKQQAVKIAGEIAKRIERENNIETLLNAKGFNKCVAVMGDDNITVVVSSNGLTTAQTMQIQDVITSQTQIGLANIKIITSK